MTRRTTLTPAASSPRARGLLCALLVGATLLGAAGCSSSGPSAPEPAQATRPFPAPRPDVLPGSGPGPVAPPPQVSAGPDEVAKAGLAVMFTWRTGSDTGPATATRRALAYLAPPMSSDVLAAPPVASPGAEWDTWAAHTAVLSPSLTPGSDDTPPDTMTSAYRQYQLTQTVRGTGGWTAPAVHSTVFVTLVHTSAGWRISQVTRA